MLLPPAEKLGQYYVFTRVCDSVHRGGVSASVPGGSQSQGVSVQGGSLSRRVTVQEGLSPGGICPGESLSCKLPPYCNEQAVRILLECILVNHFNSILNGVNIVLRCPYQRSSVLI